MKETSRLRRIVLAATLVVALVGIPVASQVEATGIDPVLLLVRQIVTVVSGIHRGVQDLQGAVAALQGGVSALQRGLAALTDPAQAAIRYTPPLYVPDSSGMLCSVSNVDDVAHAIRVDLINGNDGSIASTFISGNVPLDPGAVWVASRSVPRGPFYCKFTVLDGSRTDIRASATVLAGGPTIAAE